MRPDFIPPGQEAKYGVARGAPRDYIPGEPPDDLPVEKGGSGLSVPPEPPPPVTFAEVVAAPHPGSVPSPIMSPVTQTGTPEAAAPPEAPPEAPPAPPPEPEPEALSAPLSSREPRAESREPPHDPSAVRMTAAEKKAAKERLEREMAALAGAEEEPSGEGDPSAPPESGQKGGESREGSAPRPPGRSSPPSGRSMR